ncbi:MAG: hypothetical protein K2J82_04205, partial [Muribaculaceae bacterium]|nr:hypothetical protein [Muribaculaceae bacterium]
FFTILSVLLMTVSIHAKTLVVYYSYTNNVHHIMTDLLKQIDADVVRIQPAEKGLDYAANGYAIGSAQISAIRNNPDSPSSYPAIDPVEINLSDYDCIIIGAPLWWSNMAAPLQTFLFQHGKEMAGKHIGLIVSSSSSGISGMEGDAKRLIPEGEFFSPSLWIRSAQTDNSETLIREWLNKINYASLAGIENPLFSPVSETFTVYSLSGQLINKDSPYINNLKSGLYVINGKKTYIKN